MADPYSDPQSGVLVNKLGLTTGLELERVERDLTSIALLRLRDRPLPGGYDLAHLQSFDRAIAAMNGNGTLLRDMLDELVSPSA